MDIYGPWMLETRPNRRNVRNQGRKNGKDTILNQANDGNRRKEGSTIQGGKTRFAVLEEEGQEGDVGDEENIIKKISGKSNEMELRNGPGPMMNN